MPRTHRHRRPSVDPGCDRCVAAGRKDPGYDGLVAMKRAEREAIMRQGITLPETPRDRRQLAGLAEDLEHNPVVGRPLPFRLRNFRPGVDRYLSALGGPLAYMVRLRRIDALTEGHEASLGALYA